MAKGKMMALMCAAAVAVSSVPAFAADTAVDTEKKAVVTEDAKDAKAEEKKEEVKTDAKAEEKKEEVKTDAKAEEKKEEVKTDAKAEDKKEEVKTDAKAEDKKEEVKTDAKAEEKKEEVKTDAKKPAVGEAKVVVNGKEVVFAKQGPVIREGKTLIPVRGVMETLGVKVVWDKTARSVTMTKGDKVGVLVIDKDTFKAGDKDVKLTAPAQIINGSTMIPLRVVAEYFDATVTWDKATRTVDVVAKEEVKAEDKKEEVKTDAKAEDKKEEVKTDAKAEDKKVDTKAEDNATKEA